MMIQYSTTGHESQEKEGERVASNEERKRMVAAVTAGVEEAMRVCAQGVGVWHNEDYPIRDIIDKDAVFVARVAREHALRLAESYKSLTEKDDAPESKTPEQTVPGIPKAVYVDKGTGGPVYRTVVPDPDEAYPDESPAHRHFAPTAFVPIGEVRGRLKGRRGYIRENTETGTCRLYDQTGTFIGNVSAGTMGTLEGCGEITRRHEDDIYDTYWAREGNGNGAGAN